MENSFRFAFILDFLSSFLSSHFFFHFGFYCRAKISLCKRTLFVFAKMKLEMDGANGILNSLQALSFQPRENE